VLAQLSSRSVWSFPHFPISNTTTLSLKTSKPNDRLFVCGLTRSALWSDCAVRREIPARWVSKGMCGVALGMERASYLEREETMESRTDVFQQGLLTFFSNDTTRQGIFPRFTLRRDIERARLTFLRSLDTLTIFWENREGFEGLDIWKGGHHKSTPQHPRKADKMRTSRNLSIFYVLFLVFSTFTAAWPWPRWMPELDALIVRRADSCELFPEWRYMVWK